MRCHRRASQLRRVPVSRRPVRRRAVPLDRSTWPATASARASTATSPIRCPSGRRRTASRVLAAPAADRPGRGPTELGRPAPWPDDFDEWLDAMPRRRPDPPDAADAALRAGRLERAAPRPLRRSRVPAAGGDRPRPPGDDYTGGEFVVVEQRPRAQSRATATRRSRRATASCSRPATGRSDRRAAGRPPRCATASAPCTPGSGTRWDSSSTTPNRAGDRPQLKEAIEHAMAAKAWDDVN